MVQRSLCVWALCFVFIPTAVRAQNRSTGLAGVLPALLLDAVVTPSTVGVAGNPHEAHYLPGLNQTLAPFEVNKAIVTQLATFPVGSSSGGFTYTFDPAIGAFTRTSSTFGPSFAERAVTIGRRKFSAGLNYLHTSYSKFEGLDLDDGTVRFYLPHNDCCPGQDAATGRPGPGGTPLNPFFEGDVVEAALALDVQADTFAFFANYGLTDRVDVGVAVPIVRVDLDASVRSTILRLSTAAIPQIHAFDAQGSNVKTVGTSGSATGLGDILLRAKINAVRGPRGAVAGALDLRLPTGDDEDLLGTGATQAKVMLLASGEYGRVAPHVNVGYTFSVGELSETAVTPLVRPGLPGSDQLYTNVLAGVRSPADTIDLQVPDEFNYVGGVDVAVHPKLTVAADLIGRSLRDAQRFGLADTTFSFRSATDGPLSTATRTEVKLSERGNLNVVLGAIGAKLNVADTLLLTLNVLFPLSDAGIRSRVTPVFGFDYAF